MENRIKELRVSRGLNQEQFAEKIGVGRSTVGNYELGSRIPLDAILKNICETFGVSRAWLEFGEGPMYPPESDDEIRIITRAMEGQSDAKRRLMRFVAEMPDELVDALIAYMEGRQKK